MPKSRLKQAKILIVDDEKANIRFLEVILERAGYTNVHSTTDSRETLPLFPNLACARALSPPAEGCGNGIRAG